MTLVALNLPFGPHVERDGHPRLTYWASDVNPIFEAIDGVLDVLQACEDYLDDRVDIIDGSYGQPAPNRAMSLHASVREAIASIRQLQLTSRA